MAVRSVILASAAGRRMESARVSKRRFSSLCMPGHACSARTREAAAHRTHSTRSRGNRAADSRVEHDHGPAPPAPRGRSCGRAGGRAPTGGASVVHGLTVWFVLAWSRSGRARRTAAGRASRKRPCPGDESECGHVGRLLSPRRERRGITQAICNCNQDPQPLLLPIADRTRPGG